MSRGAWAFDGDRGPAEGERSVEDRVVGASNDASNSGVRGRSSSRDGERRIAESDARVEREVAHAVETKRSSVASWEHPRPFVHSSQNIFRFDILEPQSYSNVIQDSESGPTRCASTQHQRQRAARSTSREREFKADQSTETRNSSSQAETTNASNTGKSTKRCLQHRNVATSMRKPAEDKQGDDSEGRNIKSRKDERKTPSRERRKSTATVFTEMSRDEEDGSFERPFSVVDSTSKFPCDKSLLQPPVHARDRILSDPLPQPVLPTPPPISGATSGNAELGNGGDETGTARPKAATSKGDQNSALKRGAGKAEREQESRKGVLSSSSSMEKKISFEGRVSSLDEDHGATKSHIPKSPSVDKTLETFHEHAGDFIREIDFAAGVGAAEGGGSKTLKRMRRKMSSVDMAEENNGNELSAMNGSGQYSNTASATIDAGSQKRDRNPISMRAQGECDSAADVKGEERQSNAGLVAARDRESIENQDGQRIFDDGENGAVGNAGAFGTWGSSSSESRRNRKSSLRQKHVSFSKTDPLDQSKKLTGRSLPSLHKIVTTPDHDDDEHGDDRNRRRPRGGGNHARGRQRRISYYHPVGAPIRRCGSTVETCIDDVIKSQERLHQLHLDNEPEDAEEERPKSRNSDSHRVVSSTPSSSISPKIPSLQPPVLPKSNSRFATLVSQDSASSSNTTTTTSTTPSVDDSVFGGRKRNPYLNHQPVGARSPGEKQRRKGAVSTETAVTQEAKADRRSGASKDGAAHTSAGDARKSFKRRGSTVTSREGAPNGDDGRWRDNFSTTVTRGKMETTFGGGDHLEKQKGSYVRESAGREGKTPEVEKNKSESRQRRKSVSESNV